MGGGLRLGSIIAEELALLPVEKHYSLPCCAGAPINITLRPLSGQGRQCL
jgi:hypothetical protein